MLHHDRRRPHRAAAPDGTAAAGHVRGAARRCRRICAIPTATGSASPSARVIMYNKVEGDGAPTAPKTYEDLADPEVEGQAADPLRRATSTTSPWSARCWRPIGPEKTEAWAKGVAANLARPPRGGDTDQIKASRCGRSRDLRRQHLLLRQPHALEEAGGPRDRGQGRRGVPNQANRGTHVNISGGAVAQPCAATRRRRVKFLEYLDVAAGAAAISPRATRSIRWWPASSCRPS